MIYANEMVWTLMIFMFEQIWIYFKFWTATRTTTTIKQQQQQQQQQQPNYQDLGLPGLGWLDS